MASDAELTATVPRRDGAAVLDPAGLRSRTRDDFQTMLDWMGVTEPVQLNIHARLPGDVRPQDRADRRAELPRTSRAPEDAAEENGEEPGRRDEPALGGAELDEVRRSRDRTIGGTAARRTADPRHQGADVVRAGLYTREVSGFGRTARSVYLNVGLWTVRSAVYATMAHECAHLFLDERGAQKLVGVSSTVHSRLGEDEERRTDTVACLLGFGVLVLNGAAEFRERTGSDLLHNEVDVIAHDHMTYCDSADLSYTDATRGMTDRALAIVRELD